VSARFILPMPGMPPPQGAARTRLPRWRCGNYPQGKEGGARIGVTICRKIAQAHEKARFIPRMRVG
jgi:hypothetical protein